MDTKEFRHAHASHALDRGAPIHLVQATLGHASITTTGRYLHARPDDSSRRFFRCSVWPPGSTEYTLLRRSNPSSRASGALHSAFKRMEQAKNYIKI